MTTKRKRGHQSEKTSWIELVTKEKPKFVIPVLPRYQANLCNLTGNCQDPDSSKWLGKRIWPLQESCNDPTQDQNNENQKKEEVNGVGSQSCTCTCQTPGSVECVKLHIAEERNRLKTELGPVFEEWEFDQMGEETFSEWTETEENMFEEMIKRKQLGDKEILVQPYRKYFTNKDRKSLVRYLFNVYIPRKFSRATRASCTDVCTDDDDDENPSSSQNFNSEKSEPSNNSLKAARKNVTKSKKPVDGRNKESSKSKSKNKYLAGFR